MKALCVKLSGIGALLICLPVMYRIHEGDTFNPASYFLWSLLTVVCTVVLIRSKKGGQTMMIGYFFSDLTVAIYAYIKSGKASFGTFEWFIIALTVACTILYIWCEWKKEFRPAVFVNAIACFIAGFPQFSDSLQHLDKVNDWIIAGYFLVSALAFYGEKPTLNGRLICGLSAAYWIMLYGFLLIIRSLAV